MRIKRMLLNLKRHNLVGLHQDGGRINTSCLWMGAPIQFLQPISGRSRQTSLGRWV